MAKSITLKHVGFRCTGTALLNLWGGGQGEVEMDSWDVDTDVNVDLYVNGVNDGQFGCESIESATVRTHDLYENGYTEYNSTVDFEAKQIENATRGI